MSFAQFSRTASVCWPDRHVLAARKVTTPLLAVSLSHLRNSATRAVAFHAARGLHWQPLIARSGLRLVAETLCQQGASGVTCHHLRDALVAATVHAPSVTILIPPVSGIGPELAAEFARRTAVSIVIDHFAQAERLSDACVSHASTIDLLLRIDVGRERLGVRPGPDLHDLARGVANLPGVRLRGIAVEATTIATSGLSKLNHQELARLLERCQNSLSRAGLEIDVISISRLDDLEPKTLSGRGSIERIATHARTPLEEAIHGPYVILAGVVGRPTRHQAVIDAGREWIGTDATVAWPIGSDFRLAAVDEAFSVLHVPDDGPEVVIGDVVALVPRGDVRFPSAQSIIEDNGRWYTSPSGEG